MFPPTQEFAAHPDRQAALTEVHARPFHPISVPCRAVSFAFMTNQEQCSQDRVAFASFCERHGVAGPGLGAKHYRVEVNRHLVRWEQHAEFTTYTWYLNDGLTEPFAATTASRLALMRQLPQPGPHLASIDLHMVAFLPELRPESYFDAAALAMSSVYRNDAILATDFRADSESFVRILVLDRGLGAARAGSLIQRLLEVETYRMLALLGLPEAIRTAPSVKAIEAALVRIGRELTNADSPTSDHELLAELTELAARLETDSAFSSYRFSATAAYDNIVRQRLEAINEERIDGWTSLQSFLSRRMAPAMRTCQMLEERQANLSRKLTRAANLLRTRVDVAIERQNSALLASMDKRAKLQLRLQQTVEGLSVAAVSYYLVSLGAYVLEGLKEGGWLPIDSTVATALLVPVVLMVIGASMVRVRRHFAEGQTGQTHKDDEPLP